MSGRRAPGRPYGRSGVLLLSLLLAVGCEAIGGGSRIELDSVTVTVPGSVHDVHVSGAGARDTLSPVRVEARPGDAVRFIIDDRRPHALAFVDALADPVRRYLEETGQLRGPPLVNEGSAWVVTLEDAPPGRYPFLCRSHDAAGELIVRDD